MPGGSASSRAVTILRLIAQLLFVVAVSAATLVIVGLSIYSTIGLGIGLIALCLLIIRGPWNVERSSFEEDTDETTFGVFAFEFVYRLIFAAVLGVIWPTLPVIIGAGRAREGADHRDRPSKR